MASFAWYHLAVLTVHRHTEFRDLDWAFRSLINSIMITKGVSVSNSSDYHKLNVVKVVLYIA